MKHIKKFEGIDQIDLEKSKTYLSNTIKGVRPDEQETDNEFEIPVENAIEDLVDDLSWKDLKIIADKKIKCFTIDFPEHIKTYFTTPFFIKVDLYLLDLDNNFKDTEDNIYHNSSYIKKQIYESLKNNKAIIKSGILPLIVDAFINYFKAKWENVKSFKNSIKNIGWKDLSVDLVDNDDVVSDVYITLPKQYFSTLENITKDWNMFDPKQKYKGNKNELFNFSDDFIFHLQLDTFDFNRSHFQLGLPNFLQGIGLGMKIYKAVINVAGYISTRSDASLSAKNLWRKLIQDPDIYGLVFETSDKPSNDTFDGEEEEFINGYTIVFHKSMKPDTIKTICNDYIEEFNANKKKLVMDKELKDILKS